MSSQFISTYHDQCCPNEGDWIVLDKTGYTWRCHRGMGSLPLKHFKNPDQETLHALNEIAILFESHSARTYEILSY